MVAHKCCQLPELFGDIVLASRSESKCKRIAEQLDKPVRTAQVDADSVPQLVSLLQREQAERVRFHFGSTSSAEVWLNGKRVASLPNVKGIQHNEAVVELSLQKGRNVLMLGMERFWERRWLFYGSLSAVE